MLKRSAFGKITISYSIYIIIMEGVIIELDYSSFTFKESFHSYLKLVGHSQAIIIEDPCFLEESQTL